MLVGWQGSAGGTETPYVGASIPRKEDPRLLTGRGRFIADLRPPGCLEVAFVRSPHAHARVVRGDASPALAAPGVVAAFTCLDVLSLQPSLAQCPFPALAFGEACFVGEPVGVVAAVDRYTAEDGAEQVRVEYEVLPVVVDPEAALATDAPPARASAGSGSNLAAEYQQRVGDFQGAQQVSEVTVHRDLAIRRSSAFPLEGRGILAVPEPGGGLTVWASHQSPHRLRDLLGQALGLADHQLRVITPDVGGGFGVKNGMYPEDLLTGWLALRLGRPVRWIEDRHEHFLACQHERECVMHLDLAARRDGTILGVRARLVMDSGAYARATFVGSRALETLPGPYRVPSYDGLCRVAYTHKTPTGPYRGAGRPQGNFAMERLLDALADATGLDRAEVRLRNLIRREEMPYNTGMVSSFAPRPVVYDTGDYPGALRQLLAIVDVPAFRRRQAAAREEGRLLGLGIAFCNEDTGGAGFEGARLRIDTRGHMMAFTGSPSQGQGHETAFAQIVADALGVRPEDVAVIASDTSTIPVGVGTFGSRSAPVAGGAVAEAARRLRERILRVASRVLEVAPGDLELTSGQVRVKGAPGRSVSFAQLASAAAAGAAGPGEEPALEETVFFHPPSPAYAYGAHAAEVEVDPETGAVEVLRYVVVHDAGRLIHPQIVEGQIHGGILHGLADALYGELVHDAQGQLLTTTFLDYLLPTSTEMPRVEVYHMETPTPLNPLGAKGAGEAGTIPALACLAAAVEDALAPYGVRIDQLPMTPARLWTLLHRAKRGPA